jgi:PAS domain S-box-containing protein
MEIIPERAAVFSDPEKDELTILMDGFRIALSGSEARALTSALSRGLESIGFYQSNGSMTPQQPQAIATPDKRAIAVPPTGRAGRARPSPEALRAGLFAEVVEGANAGVIITDPHQPDNPIIFANPAAAAMTGYSVAELVGQNYRILFGPGTDSAMVDRLRQGRHSGHPVTVTLLHYRKDGTPFWANLSSSPIGGPDQGTGGFVCVLVDVTAYKRQEGDAQRARVAAERANQEKSEFIAGISHDLRTALTGLIGFTNLLLSDKLSAEQRRYAMHAREAGNSLLAVINNLLDLSKIEAGKIELTETDFGIIELAVSCHAAVWQAAREKGLDLNFVLKPDVPNMVRGDPDRIRRVLLNLLSNAVKFTEKGNVVLSLSKVEDRPVGSVLRFSVTDTGIGIAKDQQSLLFHRYSQVDGAAKRHPGGTGLGLAISKSLVEQMGGSIGVTSTPGVGSQFWFTLPLQPPAGGGSRPAPGNQARLPGGAPTRRGARILVAEDTPINQELMVTLLKKAGHDVELVTDGEAALAAVQRRAFDLVLMDVQLPRMDGFVATRAIRALDSSASAVPVIALTARALSRDVEDCLAAGMNDHLSKPIDASLLLATVDRWTRQAPPAEHPTAPGEPAPALVHDQSMLRDLEGHLGRAKVASMLAMARDDIPLRLERMQRHLSDHQFGRQQAHELVSIAGNLGFTELVTRSRRFIEVSDSGRADRVRAAFHDLKMAGDRALAVAGQLLQRARSP